tara:strand:- start:1260 stop:1448 length:189 start_codon:yes stop_codon:yes gene_type:complete
MLNIVLMHRQKTKKKKSKKNNKKATRNHVLQSEYSSYQKDNPLTEYVERVCGINSTGGTKIK